MSITAGRCSIPSMSSTRAISATSAVSRWAQAGPSRSTHLQHARAFSTTSITSAPTPPLQRQQPSPNSDRLEAASPKPPQHRRLTWPEYFALRKSRANFGMWTLYPTVPLTLVTSGSFFLTSELNPLQPIFGIDPAILAIGATLASGFAGYLVGPLLGSGLWSLVNRQSVKALQERDEEFYEHITRNRVDPARSNMQNPVPDFYGEKIYSISDYRRWLRDCSVYRRKAAHGLKMEAEEERKRQEEGQQQ